MTGRCFLRAVKTLVRVTLSDSFRIRPPSIYRAPGIARPHAQMGGLGGSEIQSFYPIRSPGGYKRCKSIPVCKLRSRPCLVALIHNCGPSVRQSSPARVALRCPLCPVGRCRQSADDLIGTSAPFPAKTALPEPSGACARCSDGRRFGSPSRTWRAVQTPTCIPVRPNPRRRRPRDARAASRGPATDQRGRPDRADLSVLLPSGAVETYVRISPPSQVSRHAAAFSPVDEVGGAGGRQPAGRQAASSRSDRRGWAVQNVGRRPWDGFGRF